MFKEFLREQEFGLKINGELVNNIKYLNDTVTLNYNIQGVQHLLCSINTVGQEMGLNINVRKSKFIVFSCHPSPDTELQIEGENIERVSSL